MPRKKTGLASSTKKRYIKSTCHCLILCQNIVGGLYTIISEGKFTQSFYRLRLKKQETVDTINQKEIVLSAQGKKEYASWTEHNGNVTVQIRC